MNYKELKRFNFSKPPTGAEIMNLTSSYSLDKWEVDIVRVHTENVGGLYIVPGSAYRYEVTFSRMVNDA